MQSSSSISILIVALLATLFISSTLGHSQMRCAKYDRASGNCLAPIRNQGPSFDEEGNDMTAGGGICQSPMSNPISASYSNGKACPDYAPCPLPMGTYKQGENFTVMWLARNHATPDQTPGNIELYLSPVEQMNQGLDVSTSVFAQNKICTAPFISCDGKNGNLVQCYATCQMPTNAVVGIHTLWWKWVWLGHTSIYTTCADIYVTASSGSVTPNTPSLPSTTAAAQPARPSTTASTPVVVPATPVTTAAAQPARPSTTAAKPVVPSTTGSSVIAPATTGRVVLPPVAATTAAVATPTAPQSNCASASVLSTSTATIESVDSWGSQFHAVFKIQVNEAILSDWVLEVTWPSQATETHVLRYFNAGGLQCEGTGTSYFKPAASWANNLLSGQYVSVELVASNTNNMDAQTILANTKLRVLKH